MDFMEATLSLLNAAQAHHAALRGPAFAALIGLSGLHISLIAFLVLGLRQYVESPGYRETIRFQQALGSTETIYTRLDNLIQAAWQNATICATVAIGQFGLSLFELAGPSLIALVLIAFALYRFAYVAWFLRDWVRGWLDALSESEMKEVAADAKDEPPSHLRDLG